MSLLHVKRRFLRNQMPRSIQIHRSDFHFMLSRAGALPFGTCVAQIWDDPGDDALVSIFDAISPRKVSLFAHAHLHHQRFWVFQLSLFPSALIFAPFAFQIGARIGPELKSFKTGMPIAIGDIGIRAASARVVHPPV
jgi:hypothetical protein